ncbi:hypothetical protein Ocin01_02170 [Orchesella cincta]|uniref:Uncharacterized protein n=1 Tax=Orchesella cincta TaxID=48709 RepID=A0A1D2NGV2_ORCCI|nr:hypothetical protein Ocin01_02170 [Orchesella cincta]
MGSNSINTSIYDLSIRDVEAVMKKLEEDNTKLRHEKQTLHQSLKDAEAVLREKDGEIRRLQRALLTERETRLCQTQQFMQQAEHLKRNQNDQMDKLLAVIYSVADAGQGSPQLSSSSREQQDCVCERFDCSGELNNMENGHPIQQGHSEIP